MSACTALPTHPQPPLAAGALLDDERFTVTFFDGFAAAARREAQHSLASLAELVRTARAPEKSRLPWLKLARFGDQRSERGSLRHDANVLAITGIELDYDGGSVPFDTAVETLRSTGISAMVYTSPSHRPEAPRWRVLCPTSRPLQPEQRAGLIGRINGLFGGIFSSESWTLSQAYYYGAVGETPDHRVVVVEGGCIDRRDDLDATWIGKPGTAPGSTPAGAPPRSGPVNEAELLEAIRSGKSYHTAAVRLAGRWARDGVPYMQARHRLIDAMETVFPPDRDERWHARRQDIDRCLENIYGKEARAADARAEAAVLALATELSEHNVALVFADRYAGQLRYCHTAGRWFVWTGTHWARNETQIAFDWGRRLTASLNEAATSKVRIATGRATFAAAVERFAQADEVFSATGETWNADPWLLATPGGTVDLTTGELRPARQSEHITRITAVAPTEAAACPRWLAFLDQATAKDQELIRFLQRWFGYCLTGITREHALLFVYGPGGNGKGVLLQTMAGVMGGYAVTAAMDTFTASQSERHSTDLAMLAGARLVMTTETEEGRAWAEARIKALTGGDPITARFMRRDNFTYTPSFKLTISGNHKPALRNVDDAARRRFNVVPFLHKPERPDPSLGESLKEEWPGILRWMIEGCLAWQSEGLKPPKVVVDATAEYFAEQDVLAQWVDEHCERGAGYGCAYGPLFASWRSYALSRSEDPRSMKWFVTMLERQGFRRDKDCVQFRGRGFVGLRLVPEIALGHWQDDRG